MILLYFLGRQVEEIFGSKQFFLLYLLSGMMGNLFVFAFTPKVVALGYPLLFTDYLLRLSSCVT